MYLYLAGPILGCTVGEANDWRSYVAERLEPHGVICVSPLRCEPLIGEKYQMTYDADPRFGTSRAISGKNLFDVRNCDMTLANLPLPAPGRNQSYGTIMEIAWTFAYQKDTILVSDDPTVLKHPVIDIAVSWKLSNLDDAIDVVKGVMGVYAHG